MNLENQIKDLEERIISIRYEAFQRDKDWLANEGQDLQNSEDYYDFMRDTIWYDNHEQAAFDVGYIKGLKEGLDMLLDLLNVKDDLYLSLQYMSNSKEIDECFRTGLNPKNLPLMHLNAQQTGYIEIDIGEGAATFEIKNHYNYNE